MKIKSDHVEFGKLMSPKIIAILQARSESSRLPGKIHLNIGDFSVIEFISYRLRNLNVDEKWLATTTLNSDDSLVNIGKRLGWRVYRGSSTNVLSRFQAIITTSNPDYVIRLTGDNPLVDSQSINHMISQYLSYGKSVVYVSDFDEREYPIGSFPELINVNFFEQINMSINPKQNYHYSHVTSWMRENAPKVRLQLGKDFPSARGYRWTLDTKEDYEFFLALNKSVASSLINLNYLQLTRHLNDNPDIASINKNILQKDMRQG
jgi:spore coat polysaccharide biosynthesis protein SpsF